VQITRQVDFDKEQKAGYIEMFRKPSWRKRSLLTLFIQSVIPFCDQSMLDIA
jgi:hypothetical protein